MELPASPAIGTIWACPCQPIKVWDGEHWVVIPSEVDKAIETLKAAGWSFHEDSYRGDLVEGILVMRYDGEGKPYRARYLKEPWTEETQ